MDNNSALPATTIANKTIGYFGKYMNLVATVARDWDYEPATEGESVKIGKRGALTANTKLLAATLPCRALRLQVLPLPPRHP